MKEDADPTDYEAQSFDCVFSDDTLLPKSVTLCIRDTFLKKTIDVYSKDLVQKTQNIEDGILSS